MAHAPHKRTILLTGATGTLGGEILNCYLNSPADIDIRVLVRGTSDQAKFKFSRLVADKDETTRARFDRLAQPIWGDLQHSQLGLPVSEYRELAERVTDIIHSAAAIDFALPIESARAVNYQGTVNLLNFARNCARLDAIAHISTAHVAGKRTGLITETELEHNSGFVNSYEQSKYEAEQYVRSQMKDLPIAVYRSTTLIGDSRSGKVRQFNFFHYAARFAYHGLIPAIPGVPNGHIDLIPVDYAASAIQFLIDRNFRCGATYHICAGPENSFILQSLIDETFDIFQSSAASKKKGVYKFPIVDESTFDQIVRKLKNNGQGRGLQALAPLAYFLPHLALPKIFDATQTNHDLHASGLNVPNIRSYYRPIIEYCLQTDWGRRES